MTPEQRLDCLERIMKLVVRAGLRERRETRDKINALIDAHIRTEDTIEKMSQRTEEAMARLAQEQGSLVQSQATTDEKLNSFISTVEKLIKERRRRKRKP